MGFNLLRINGQLNVAGGPQTEDKFLSAAHVKALETIFLHQLFTKSEGVLHRHTILLPERQHHQSAFYSLYRRSGDGNCGVTYGLWTSVWSLWFGMVTGGSDWEPEDTAVVATCQSQGSYGWKRTLLYRLLSLQKKQNKNLCLHQTIPNVIYFPQSNLTVKYNIFSESIA